MTNICRFRQCYGFKIHYQSVLVTLELTSLNSAAFEDARKTSITKHIKRKNRSRKSALTEITSRKKRT